MRRLALIILALLVALPCLGSDDRLPEIRRNDMTPTSLIDGHAAWSEDGSFQADTRQPAVLDIQYLGSTFWTIVNDLVVDGDYVYCAFVNGLVVFDISDSTNPVMIASEYTQGRTEAIFKSGDYVYLADLFEGLSIINVADPANPFTVGSYDTPDRAHDVFVQGNLAYIADGGYGGLQIVDVSSPNFPLFVGSFDAYGVPEAVFVQGSIVFLAEGGSGIEVVDAGNPANPVLLGEYNTPGSAESIDIQDTLAFIADYDSGLVILNISDPASPEFIGSFPTADYDTDVKVRGSMAFVGIGNGGMRIIDVSDPAIPQLLGSTDAPGATEGVAIRNDLAFLAARYGGLQVIDITDPALPAPIGSYEVEHTASELFVQDSLVYIVDELWGALHVVNAVDPADPQLIGSTEIPSWGGSDIQIVNNLAYLAHGNVGLYILDVSDPLAPSYVGEYNTVGFARTLAIRNNLAFIGVSNVDLFYIFNITDPSAPDSIGAFVPAGPPFGIHVQDTLAYIACGYSGIQVANVIDSTNPLPVGSFATVDFASDVIVQSTLAFVSIYNYGLLVLDVTDPSAPDSLGSFLHQPCAPVDLFLKDSLIYLASSSHVDIVNIADPANPVLFGSYDTPGGPGGITAVDSLVYVADGASLLVLKTSLAGPSQEIHVTNTNDDGPGSLREALFAAFTTPGQDTIVFDVSGIIQLTTGLELAGEDPIYIRGSSAPGGLYSVILDGSLLGSGNGLSIYNPGNHIEGLVITGFPDNGILVTDYDSVYSVTLTHNLIYGNGLLPIDLKGDGVTDNDIDDLDTGPNGLLNFPEIDSINSESDASYSVYGTTAGLAIVEFYLAHPAFDTTRPANPSGHGDAYECLGSAIADIAGGFTFNVDASVKPFSLITCIAIDTLGNTSEMSLNHRLNPKPLIVVAYTYADTGARTDKMQNGINIIVEDPTNARFGKDSLNVVIDEIPDAEYWEIPNDSVVIPDPVNGEYTIYFVGVQGESTEGLYAAIIKTDGLEQMALVNDEEIPSSGVMQSRTFIYDEGGLYINGDANADLTINVADAVFIVSYIFRGGPAPNPLLSGDANCDGAINVADAVYLITYIFKGGPKPCGS